MDLAVRQSAVAEARAAIETARKAMRKKLPPPENTLSQPGPSQHSGQDFLSPEDYVEQDEIFKVRPRAVRICSIFHEPAGMCTQEGNALAPKPYISCCRSDLVFLVVRRRHVQARVAALKREEDSLNKERERLEAEKARHIRSVHGL